MQENASQTMLTFDDQLLKEGGLFFTDYPDVVTVDELCHMLGDIGKIRI